MKCNRQFQGRGGRIMKIVVPLALIISLMWFFSETRAENNAAASCSGAVECFYYVDNQIIMPSGTVSEYAQYAALDKHFSTGGERTFVFSPRYREWAAYD